MRAYDLILKKRDGNALTEAEIRFLITGCTNGDIPDYQLAAWMMAVYFQGLTEQEATFLTKAMAESGGQVDLSRFGNKTADKHSTGGVGDKTTLITAPIAAACGVIVAKMSGRGLGHTGGTVDKLESIPGFQTEMEQADFLQAVEKTGLAVVGQSGNLAPADKKLYALRDVTATVENSGLIASSIMSKKLAAGAKNIVLDVKFGSGAFMKTKEEAKALARLMVAIGKGAGRNTAAVLTNMKRPLGRNIGNALEVVEAVDTLKGNGPEDLTEVCLTLASKMIELALQKEVKEARRLAETALKNGSALEKLKEMVSAQGGDISYLENPEKFPRASHEIVIKADRDGFVSELDALQIGLACVHLGAGRNKKEDSIDHSAGIVLNKKPGDPVKAGEPLAVLYTSRQAWGEAEALVSEAYKIGEAPEAEPLISGVIL